MEDVEAFGCKGELAFAEGACERGIPHEVVGVHRAVAIATARVLLEVLAFCAAPPITLKRRRSNNGKRHFVFISKKD